MGVAPFQCRGTVEGEMVDIRKKKRIAKHGDPTRKKLLAVGEGHPRACCSDHEVDLCRRLYWNPPPGVEGHMGYRVLSAKFGVGKRTIRDWINGKKRSAVDEEGED